MADGSILMDGHAAAPATPRYARKKEAILAAATTILNRQGVKGMTLADVANEVGLITTSVTYYYRKKDDLAAACFCESGPSRVWRLTARWHIRSSAFFAWPTVRMA